MDKHTPGPWFLIEADGTDFTAIATKPAISGAMDLSVEVLGSSEWLRVKPKDLHLMAAAPELLEALELADQMLSGANMDAKAVENKVRSALAKAHGELFNARVQAAAEGGRACNDLLEG